MPYGRAVSARRATASGVVCCIVTALSVPVLLVAAGRLFQIERTERALREVSSGSTLATIGVGMLLFGGVGWSLDRRARRRGVGSRTVVVLAVLSVLWPSWIAFVHWYDGR